MNNTTRSLPDIEIDAYTHTHWPQSQPGSTASISEAR